MRLFRTAFFSAAAVALASLAISGAAHAQDTTVKVDTTQKDSTKIAIDMEQGLRGREVFTKTCLECHTKTDVTGQDFKLKWHTRPVWDLLDVIRTTMPDDKPGSLTPEQYIDVTAYLLRINGAAFGGAALVPGDTATLKKYKMEILVPSPNADSTASAIRMPDRPVNSTPARIGVNHLLTRQSNKR